MGIIIEIPFRTSEAAVIESLDEAFNVTGSIERPPQQLRFRFHAPSPNFIGSFAGKKHSKESRARISAACAGVPKTEAHKQKIREAALRREAFKRQSKERA